MGPVVERQRFNPPAKGASAITIWDSAQEACYNMLYKTCRVAAELGTSHI